MATVSCKLKAANIKIVRQSGSDNFYASWSLTTAQKKKKITRKVYNSSKKKTVSTTKKYPDVIDSYKVKWYYRVTKGGTWYLNKTITDNKVRNTTKDLWTPPAEAVQLKVTVEPISKKYKKSKNKSANWFDVDPTSKIDSDYDEYPQTPSIGEFSIKGKTLKAQVVFNLENFDRLETTAVRLQVLRNGSTLIKFKNNKADETGEYYIEKKFTETNPIDSSGIVNFVDVELDTTGSYQVRGAIASYDGAYRWSEYSSWSSSIDTRPNTPTIKTVEAIEVGKVKLTWTAIDNIEQYEIEYASDKESYFDAGAFQTVTVNNNTSHIISGLESGHTWYFRVRSVNNADKSSPSETVKIVLAEKPNPPTTWSSVNVGSIKSTLEDTEPIYLYWVHNSVDGSVQKMARIKITIAGVAYFHKAKNTKTDQYGELIDETSRVSLWDLEVYEDANVSIPAGTVYSIFRRTGAKSLKWKIATRGLTVDDDSMYSDYSIERTIEAYESPNLELIVSDCNGVMSGDKFNGFPLSITGVVTPSSQTPISFYISIISGDTYDTTDIYGNDVTVADGTEIYTKFIDEPSLNHIITAGDVDFFTGVPYELKVVAYTDAGLNTEATCILAPEWEELGEEPDALIEINETFRYATIRPFCNRFIGFETDEIEGLEEYEPVCHVGTVTPNISGTAGDMYFNTSTFDVYACIATGKSWEYRTTFDYSDSKKWYTGTVINGETENDIYTNSGIIPADVNDYYFNTDSGDIFRCIKAGDPDTAVWEYVWNCFWEVTPNIELAIYRKDANGGYITIAEHIDNAVQSSDSAVTFRDPHPSFNSCVYRIVATNTENGAIGYVDITENLPESSVVIQWDETWNDVVETEEGEIFEGSILELPANIDLSDTNSMDVNFANYIGRSRPVTYYGTQKGEKPTIKCEFDASDDEKLSLLRRLMMYPGDVYIREPSGLGYWANVVVSYSKNHIELTIPVTLTITPVEGGI